MFCTKCGNEVSDVALFCTKCGAKIEREVVEPKAEPKVEEAKAEPKVEEVKAEPKEETKKKEYSNLEKALNNMQNRQKRCPNCGALVLNESQFCRNCGKSI